MKKKTTLLICGVLLATSLVCGGVKIINHIKLNSYYEPAIASTRVYLMQHSTPRCHDSEIKPIKAIDGWILAMAYPDMKECITDAIFVIMKFENGEWKGFDMGSCCFKGAPKELFEGIADWPSDANGYLTGELE